MLGHICEHMQFSEHIEPRVNIQQNNNYKIIPIRFDSFAIARPQLPFAHYVDRNPCVQPESTQFIKHPSAHFSRK